jgi:tetratricopeptide (TPR) repeat protein
MLLAAPSLAAANGEAEQATECRFADALAQGKEVKPARKAYVEVLKVNPASKCAENGLAALNAPSTKSAGEERSDAVDEIVGWLSALAILIGLAALLFFAFLFLDYIPKLGLLIRKIPVIGTFFNSALAPRLSFGEIDDKSVDHNPGPALTARIKRRLGQMREEATSNELEYDLDSSDPRQRFADVVSETGGLKSALESASDVSDQTKAVAALLSIFYTLLPIKRFEISGSLEPPTKTGAAATLILEEGSGFVSATSLHGAPCKGDSEANAAEYMQLADPAAVWIQYEIVANLSHQDTDVSLAESQALIREGIDHLERGERSKACASFEKALRVNRDNWAAYLGLGIAEARLGKDFKQAIARIEEGIRLMREHAHA